MLDKFPDVLQFCGHVSRLMVSEIRRRASNQSTGQLYLLLLLGCVMMMMMMMVMIDIRNDKDSSSVSCGLQKYLGIS